MTYAQRTIRVKITLNGEEIKEDRPVIRNLNPY